MPVKGSAEVGVLLFSKRTIFPRAKYFYAEPRIFTPPAVQQILRTVRAVLFLPKQQMSNSVISCTRI